MLIENEKIEELIRKWFFKTGIEFYRGVREATRQMALLEATPQGKLYYYENHFRSWTLLTKDSTVVAYTGLEKNVQELIARLALQRELMRGSTVFSRSEWKRLPSESDSLEWYHLLYVAFWDREAKQVETSWFRGGDWASLCIGERTPKTERDSPFS